jgi:replicative DNA helicase
MRAFPENIDPRTNRTLDRPKVIPVHFFVAKNRNGEMGKSDLVKWNKATGAFQTLVRE